MATKRCIPTDLFFNLPFMHLHSNSTRLVLIGLITDADDAGRGQADPALLARKLGQDVALIQEALADLSQTGFVQCYLQGNEAYYFLCRWYEWQKLSKPTPSRYPAPPQNELLSPPGYFPGEPGETLGNPIIPPLPRSEEKRREGEGELEGEEKRREIEGEGEKKSREVEAEVEGEKGGRGLENAGAGEKKSREVVAEVEGEKGGRKAANAGEGAEKRRESAGEGEADLFPSNVLVFPHSSADTAAAQEVRLQVIEQYARQIAQILCVAPDASLERIVQDYGGRADLFLAGEADAARQWIDDGKRNRQRQQMSTSFFRRWLKREVEALERRQASLQSSTPAPTAGSEGRSLSGRTALPAAERRLPNLMGLADEDERAGEGRR